MHSGGLLVLALEPPLVELLHCEPGMRDAHTRHEHGAGVMLPAPEDLAKPSASKDTVHIKVHL